MDVEASVCVSRVCASPSSAVQHQCDAAIPRHDDHELVSRYDKTVSPQLGDLVEDERGEFVKLDVPRNFRAQAQPQQRET